MVQRNAANSDRRAMQILADWLSLRSLFRNRQRAFCVRLIESPNGVRLPPERPSSAYYRSRSSTHKRIGRLSLACAVLWFGRFANYASSTAQKQLSRLKKDALPRLKSLLRRLAGSPVKDLRANRRAVGLAGRCDFQVPTGLPLDCLARI